jgi:sterol desaturase/sphingolipid hydroxylase (fatty acid hydroxylase superfamily)
MYIIGFSSEVAIYASIIRNLYNEFVHCNIRLVYPSFLHYIFVSPHCHKWHHATDKEAINKNFCTVFSFIDVIFGTFYCPRDKDPKSCGLFDEEEVKPKFKNNIISVMIFPFARHYHFIKKKLEKKN